MPISTAYAQAAGGAPAGFDLISLMPLVLIFVVFYFLLIRPQQKKMRAHRELIATLKRGDKVLTAGGIIGTVVKVDEDNTLLVEIAKDIRVRVARGTISELLNKPAATAAKAPAAAGAHRRHGQDRIDVAAVRQEVGPDAPLSDLESRRHSSRLPCRRGFQPSRISSRAPRWSACRTGCRTSRSISGSTSRAAPICCSRSISMR